MLVPKMVWSSHGTASCFSEEYFFIFLWYGIACTSTALSVFELPKEFSPGFFMQDSDRRRSPHLLPYIYVDEAIKIANRYFAAL
jgi:hypothetical protein